jgi:hypothetical protein
MIHEGVSQTVSRAKDVETCGGEGRLHNKDAADSNRRRRVKFGGGTAMRRGKTRFPFTAATMAVYLTAFFLLAWHDSSKSGGYFGSAFQGRPISGARAFVMSLYVVVVGMPMWLANPAYWFGLYSLGRGWPRTARVSSVVAVLLAVSALFFCWREVHVGYWLWLASMGFLLASCFWESPEDARRSCPFCTRLVWAGLGVLGLIIGTLLVRWTSSFGCEDLLWR